MKSLPHSRLGRGFAALGIVVGILFPGLASADSGYATWYGPGFQGNTMYNGQRFDMYDPTTTAANIFPLGTWIKVTNPANGRSVVVQVRDRGGFTHTLDLSYAAFKAIADPALMGIPIDYQVVSGPAGAPLAPRATPSSRGSRPAPATTYVVRSGDTLEAIAARTGVSVDNLAAWNALGDPNQIIEGQVLRLVPTVAGTSASTAGTNASYVVQDGDTLSTIAQRFGLTTDQLAAANQLADPNNLAVGQSLVIPSLRSTRSSRSYTVQPGDTLSGIADSYGVSVNSLVAANSLADPSLIQPGMVLAIPSP